MLTGNLLRAARVLAGLGRGELAARADLPRDAVLDIESAGPSALRPDDPVARKVRAALEKTGIEFLEDGGSGVRLRTRSSRHEGILTQDLNAENDD